MISTACPNDEEADRLASALIEKGYAACVQAGNITSTYRWKGRVHKDPEVQIVIKARSDRYEEIEATIMSTLSYENPEILVFPVVDGSQRYLDWIDEQTDDADF